MRRMKFVGKNQKRNGGGLERGDKKAKRKMKIKERGNVDQEKIQPWYHLETTHTDKTTATGKGDRESPGIQGKKGGGGCSMETEYESQQENVKG